MEEKYIDDLKEIKEIMSRSSRFISLSGLSGVAAGLSALIGAHLVNNYVLRGQDLLTHGRVNISSDDLYMLICIALGTLVVSIGAGIFFTTRETIRQNQRIWDAQTKRLIFHLLIPLVSGGILCFMLLQMGFLGLVIPLTLIFYGLALVNASKYTLNLIKSLGILEIMLGLIAVQFVGYGLYFWALGFGILHIIYGLLLYWNIRS